MFPQGLESLCPGHSLLASCFTCQREGLILTASASTARGALGEVLGGNLADTTAEGGLADDLVLRQGGVELRLHDVAVGVGILADLLQLFVCFYFQCHDCTN